MHSTTAAKAAACAGHPAQAQREIARSTHLVSVHRHRSACGAPRRRLALIGINTVICLWALSLPPNTLNAVLLD
jgi:hypothetical protein